MHLLIARHGETDWLLQYRYQGLTDVPLNDKGRQETGRLVEYLASLKPRAVYSSGLVRTDTPARALAEKCAIPHHVDDRIIERHFGVWEGLTWEEIKTRYPDQVEPYRRGDMDFAPEGGESLKAVHARWRRFREHLFTRHGEETVACLSHGGYIRVVLLDTLHAPLHRFHHIQQDTGAVNILRGDAEHMRVVLMNSVAHLDASNPIDPSKVDRDGR